MEKKEIKKKENKNNNKIPKWGIVLIVLGVICTIVPIISIALLFSSIAIDDIRNDKSLKNDLVLNNDINSYYDKETNEYIIEGTISNKGKDDYYGVNVTFRLYDENNNILDLTEDNIMELEKGKTWKFSCSYIEKDAKDVKRVELKEINGDSNMY